MIDLTSILWECPVCGKSVEIKIDPYHREDQSKVDDHKKAHQQFGMVLP